MRIQVELRIVSDDSSVISEGEILHLNKGDDRLEVVGLAFDEAKGYLPASREAWSPPRRQVFWRGIGAVVSAAVCC
jgi:hypothetical protein